MGDGGTIADIRKEFNCVPSVLISTVIAKTASLTGVRPGAVHRLKREVPGAS